MRKLILATVVWGSFVEAIQRAFTVGAREVPDSL